MEEAAAVRESTVLVQMSNSHPSKADRIMTRPSASQDLRALSVHTYRICVASFEFLIHCPSAIHAQFVHLHGVQSTAVAMAKVCQKWRRGAAPRLSLIHI